MSDEALALLIGIGVLTAGLIALPIYAYCRRPRPTEPEPEPYATLSRWAGPVRGCLLLVSRNRKWVLRCEGAQAARRLLAQLVRWDPEAPDPYTNFIAVYLPSWDASITFRVESLGYPTKAELESAPPLSEEL